jgi:hypothetical protein
MRDRDREGATQTSLPMLCRTAMVAAVCSQVLLGGARAATIPVTSASDALAADGVCTLREAMASANNNMAPFPTPGECVPGNQGWPDTDTIVFAIPGSGVHTITLTSTDGLPAITAPIVIDGYTQPGASPNTLAVGNDAVLRIEIDAGAVTGGFAAVFRLHALAADNSTIRGLVINDLKQPAVDFGGESHDNVFAGNFVGTNATGSAMVGTGATTLIAVAGTGNRIGGPAPADRNLLVGLDGGLGQILVTGATGTVIQGNYLGTNAAGTQALLPASPTRAILVQSSGNTIGGPGAGNVILAHIAIWLNSGDDNTVQGNRLGTDATGTLSLRPREGFGILSGNTAANNQIGGVGAEGNVIGNFVYGLFLTDGAPGWTVQGNRIGTDATGTLALPNELGIHIQTAGPGSIGGTDPGEGNVIAFNTSNGINISSGTGWSLLGNSIHDNGGLGISLTNTLMPLPNDAGDGDDGANNRQNYPVITASDIAGSSVNLAGSLNSTPSTPFRLEVFASAACDSSGFGEGQSLAGVIDVTTDGSGNASFGPLVIPVPAGRKAMTMTATGPGGNTSELSGCVLAGEVFSDGFETGNASRWSGAVP